MTLPLLAGFMLSFILATQMKIYNASLNADKVATETKIHYTKMEDELIDKVKKARDSYIKIYNSLPANVDILISKGFLEPDFKNSEFGKKIVINNGEISYLTNDVELSNMFITSNLKKYESSVETNSTISLKNQSDTINMIKSNDLDETKNVDFSNIVKNQNVDLANQKKSDLKIESSQIKEQENNTNSEMLRILTF